MSNIWRFTGPPENWITAFGVNKWALNDHNKSLWENSLKPGDTVIFHSTRKSEFSNEAQSCVIGFGYVGSSLVEKKEFWWIQEIRDEENYWPYVVPFKEIYLFSETEEIDFATPIEEKNEDTIKREIEILVKDGIPLVSLNALAESLNGDVPKFPVNGSASSINTIYEQLILSQDKDFIAKDALQDTEILETKLSESMDERMASMTKDEVLDAARSYRGGTVGYSVKIGKTRVRKENQAQKRRVAKIENYTCQVCRFYYEYKKANGKSGWIIHVDHIIEKSDGGDENLKNLWVLCPNCHAKKTYGAITINLDEKKVYENGSVVEIQDDHLFN